MPKVPVTCQECGKTFEANQSDINRGRKFCSHECSVKAHIGEKHPNWKPKIKRICKECGKEFEIKSATIRYGKGNYCSRVCKDKAQSKIIGENSPHWQGGKVINKCEECGKEFPVYEAIIKQGKGKYCSKLCANKAKSQLYVGENAPNYKGKVIKKCQECGKEFPVYESVIKNGHGKFCSQVCKGKWQSKNIVGENAYNYKGKVIKKCQECGKEFPFRESELNQGRRKYCSKVCANKAKSRLYSGENSWEWKEKIIRKCRTCGKEILLIPSLVKENKRYYCSKVCRSQDSKFPTILKNCKFCGKEFPSTPSTQRPEGRNYCSRECFLKGAGKNFSGKNRIKNVCRVCGKEFESFPMRVKKSEILYCSRKCYAIDQSKRFVGENSFVWKEKVTRICPICNSEFSALESRVESNRGIYCSKKCQNIAFGESVTGEKNPNWTGGPKEYCEKWSPEFRRRIRAFFDHICVECGTPQNERKLSCHHVYYDKKACCSVMEDGKFFSNLGIKGQPFTFEIIGDPNKFILLCHNCHAKTTHRKTRHLWARHFEEIINNYYLGRSYFTKEEYKKIR